MLKEFKSFALRGNVLDLAVGIIIGAAFTTVVNSLAKDVIMQAMAALVGEPDFSALTLPLGHGAINYGIFLTTLTNFLLVSFAVFVMVKAINRMMRPRGAPAEAPSMRECPFCRLTIPASAVKCQGCTSEVEPLAA